MCVCVCVGGGGGWGWTHSCSVKQQVKLRGSGGWVGVGGGGGARWGEGGGRNYPYQYKQKVRTVNKLVQAEVLNCKQTAHNCSWQKSSKMGQSYVSLIPPFYCFSRRCSHCLPAMLNFQNNTHVWSANCVIIKKTNVRFSVFTLMP